MWSGPILGPFGIRPWGIYSFSGCIFGLQQVCLEASDGNFWIVGLTAQPWMWKEEKKSSMVTNWHVHPSYFGTFLNSTFEEKSVINFEIESKISLQSWILNLDALCCCQERRWVSLQTDLWGSRWRSGTAWCNVPLLWNMWILSLKHHRALNHLAKKVNGCNFSTHVWGD